MSNHRTREEAANRLITRVCDAYIDQQHYLLLSRAQPTDANTTKLWEAQRKFNRRRNRLFRILVQCGLELEPE